MPLKILTKYVSNGRLDLYYYSGSCVSLGPAAGILVSILGTDNIWLNAGFFDEELSTVGFHIINSFVNWFSFPRSKRQFIKETRLIIQAAVINGSSSANV